MTATASPSALAGEFPAAERDQWVLQAAKALVRNLAPDDDPERVIARLRSTTYDGIVIEPLYTGESGGEGAGADSGDMIAAGFPGFSPFVRGRTAGGTRADGWDIRQIVDAGEPDFTATAELENGATSLWLDTRSLPTVDRDALATALSGVYLDLTSVTLESGNAWPAAAEALIQLWSSNDVAGESAKGSFGADPFGAYVSTGGSAEAMKTLSAATEFAGRLATTHPQVRVIAVDATRFHNAGGSDGQELGYALAVLVETLRAFEAAGLDLATSFRQIELRLAATSDQFATIAKFRAARRLLARIAEVAGVPAAAGDTQIHAVTSLAMMTRYDPWVNLLRATTACFGAGIAGADAITVLPYDVARDPSGSELGRRIARNTQSILAKESNLTQVVDPSGGSWYVESLTDQLAHAAWASFQQIEVAGGVVAAVDSGIIAHQIDAAWQARRRNIVTRKDPLTGVSEFPNVLEAPPPPRSTVVASGGGVLPLHRYAEPIEALRERVDHVTDQTSVRPAVFLVNIASPAVHTARATFAKNLFEIAGLVTIAGPGSTDPEELGAQFAASGAAVACICSSDAMYGELGVHVAAALRAHDPAVVYVAGRPKDIIDELTAAGVDGFIAAGADVEQTLSDLLQRLDVP